MSAAERLERTPRQRRRDAVLLMFTTLANQLCDMLDEIAINGGETSERAAPKRRTIQRQPYVPTHGQTPSTEAMNEAARQTRRRGIR